MTAAPADNDDWWDWWGVAGRNLLRFTADSTEGRAILRGIPERIRDAGPCWYVGAPWTYPSIAFGMRTLEGRVVSGVPRLTLTEWTPVWPMAAWRLVIGGGTFRLCRGDEPLCGTHRLQPADYLRARAVEGKRLLVWDLAPDHAGLRLGFEDGYRLEIDAPPGEAGTQPDPWRDCLATLHGPDWRALAIITGGHLAFGPHPAPSTYTARAALAQHWAPTNADAANLGFASAWSWHPR